MEAFPSQAGACLYSTGNFPSHPGQEVHNTEILVIWASEYLPSFPCSQSAPQNPGKRKEHPARAHSSFPLICLSPLECVLLEAGPHFGNPRGFSLCGMIWIQTGNFSQLLFPLLAKCEEWYQQEQQEYLLSGSVRKPGSSWPTAGLWAGVGSVPSQAVDHSWSLPKKGAGVQLTATSTSRSRTHGGVGRQRGECGAAATF